MNRPWLATAAVDLQVARHLATTQAPRFVVEALKDLRPLGVGWDNTVFRAGRFVLRFPRRDEGAECLDAELRMLPILGEALPVPVPTVRFVGSPSGDYPYTWAVYDHVAGVTACRAGLPSDNRRALAESTAACLRALHDLPADAHRRARTDAIAGLPRADLLAPRIPSATLDQRIDAMRGRVEQIAIARADLPLQAAVDAVIARIEASPEPARATTWLHGDLYGRHLLVGDEGTLAGLIDFGDTHRGDVARDLAIAWSFFAPADRRAFFAVYGDTPARTADRAIARALYHAIAQLAYGLDVGDDALVRIGAAALTFGLAN